MAEQSRTNDRETRAKVSFELDESTLATLKGIAYAEHRTLSAQLRVITEDFVAEQQDLDR